MVIGMPWFFQALKPPRIDTTSSYPSSFRMRPASSERVPLAQ